MLGHSGETVQLVSSLAYYKELLWRGENEGGLITTVKHVCATLNVNQRLKTYKRLKRNALCVLNRVFNLCVLIRFLER